MPSPEEKEAHIAEGVRRAKQVRVFENNLYHVEMVPTPPLTPTFIHLVIHRHDMAPCTAWAHFQQIKNEIIGPEYEAMELFPAESRLVDAGNLYHLWVHSDPRFRFPVGWFERFVPNPSPGHPPISDATQRSAGCPSVECRIPVGRLAILSTTPAAAAANPAP